jgi:hypothetical protein
VLRKNGALDAKRKKTPEEKFSMKRGLAVSNNKLRI